MILKRQELTSPITVNFDDDLRKAREELHNQAYEVLGWRSEPPTRPAYTLRNTLRKLEIQPFTDRSVAAYQALLVVRPPLGAWVRACFSALSIYGTVHCWRAALYAKDGFFWGLSALVLGVSSIVFTILTIKRYAETERNWECLRLSEYHNMYGDRRRRMLIPDHALQTGIRLKQALPAADICVEFLQEKRNRIQLIDPDPFLVAKLGNEKFYLEVWDERDYKEERES